MIHAYSRPRGSDHAKPSGASIRAAVTLATSRPSLASIGARIEEILRAEIAAYPDEIISLDLLPYRGGFEFTGWTSDFRKIHCIRMDKTKIDQAEPGFLVGWKPIRNRDIQTPKGKPWEVYGKK